LIAPPKRAPLLDNSLLAITKLPLKLSIATPQPYRPKFPNPGIAELKFRTLLLLNYLQILT
jgi:hypothetical protein